MGKKWRKYVLAHNPEALHYVIRSYYNYRLTVPGRGRMSCPNIMCVDLRRATRSFDLALGVTYCHNCATTLDALALLQASTGMTLNESYDALEKLNLIPIDLPALLG